MGNVNQSSAVPVQFANSFILPRRATIHFVDRYGNPLTGVAYEGPSEYPVTAKEDGTFTVPYIWDGTNGSLHLDTDPGTSLIYIIGLTLTGIAGTVLLMRRLKRA